MWGLPQKLAKPRLAAAHNTLMGTLEYGPVQVAKVVIADLKNEAAEPAARYHRRERKEKHCEEDCTAAYGRCRAVRDERRRSRDDRSGSERIRRV
jgi:hypothetical protein